MPTSAEDRTPQETYRSPRPPRSPWPFVLGLTAFGLAASVAAAKCIMLAHPYAGAYASVGLSTIIDVLAVTAGTVAIPDEWRSAGQAALAGTVAGLSVVFLTVLLVAARIAAQNPLLAAVAMAIVFVAGVGGGLVAGLILRRYKFETLGD